MKVGSNASWRMLVGIQKFQCRPYLKGMRLSLLTYLSDSFSYYRNWSGIKLPRPLSLEDSFSEDSSFFYIPGCPVSHLKYLGQYLLEFHRQKVALNIDYTLLGPLSRTYRSVLWQFRTAFFLFLLSIYRYSFVRRTDSRSSDKFPRHVAHYLCCRYNCELIS